MNKVNMKEVLTVSGEFEENPKKFYYKANVVRVVDGDTLDVEIDMGFHIGCRQRLRLMGVDTPEISTPEGKGIKAILQELLEGKTYKIYTIKPDKYGRYLFDLLISSELGWLSDYMISHKYAVKYDGGQK